MPGKEAPKMADADKHFMPQFLTSAVHLYFTLVANHTLRENMKG
jgi:hypothetical protein